MMNASTASDGTEKAWDHPWTTDEMRQHQNDWSLAGDVGILRHLQQFSEDLTARVQDTQTTLDKLNSQLNETTVVIDNVTNASLALANTQFIESRVHEDDTDRAQLENIKEKVESSSELNEADMIAAVSESIQQGLAIMDEKYERLEVVASDSEDDNEMSAPSFILRPKNPYQNRPLPFVIGSDKWKASSKIGLESSSSESEVMDDDEGDTESDREVKLRQHIFNSNSQQKTRFTRSSSSSSSRNSSDFNEKSNTNKQYSGLSSHTDKLHTRSQDTLNSTSEITTPTTGILSKGDGFAEELAKRLGSVLPIQKTVIDNRDTDQSSINRSKDELFASENKNDEDIFSSGGGGGGGGLFDDEVSSSLWKVKPIKPKTTNIIPPSLDLPPPINSVDTKPKSAIDDLFGDGDSDDSDDIFAPRSMVKNQSIKSTVDTMTDKTKSEIVASQSNDSKYTGINKSNNEKITTSTPETNNNIPNLFEDDDDENLFQSLQNTAQRRSPETVRTAPKGRPGVLVSQADLLSSSLGSRLFQRTQQESSDSSDDSERQQNSNKQNITDYRENSNSTLTSESSAMVAGQPGIENSGSSGISVQPRSINSTLGLSVGNWAPEMESTRLPSEELYRGRIASDSLLNTTTQQQANSISTNSGVNASIPPLDARIQESSSILENDLFDNDDIFSPPPLPKNDTKSKVISLFDDSDSGDDLFSNTSSGSRSQKSADTLANPPQVVEKSKTSQKRGLFDEDIFANRDTSGIDIFATETTLKISQSTVTKVPQFTPDTSSNKVSELTTVVEVSKKVKPTSIFDDSEEEDEDLFGTKIRKPSIIFNDDEANLFANTSRSENIVQTVPKKDSIQTKVPAMEGEKESAVESEQKLDSDQPVDKVTTRITSESKLFDDSDGEDDDSLFSQKKSSLTTAKPQGVKNAPTQQLNSQSLNIENKIQVSSSTQESQDITQVKLIEDKESETVTDGVKNSKMSNPEECQGENKTKKEPPKSLKIRLPIVGATDDVNPAPRRAVSGKIKDLMGKMGDLKILSPTDTPLVWRKTGDKDSEDENTPDRDSEDGSSISIPSPKSSPIIQKENVLKKSASQSPSIETETAVSFDVPAQVETLTVTASKSRARIPIKRRPQSRHARQSALRTSGIDFDAVDTSTSIGSSQETSTTDSNVERLTASHDHEPEKATKLILNSLADDKSEISLGKESSISITKNTLLSPSTDEEDLFDVPPDLPEDPQKEDSLFGRAPILSPVPARRTEKKSLDQTTKKIDNSVINDTSCDKSNNPKDPLRDSSLDPLKDPSQLFAFVTKTPSPEKGQNVLFNEDNSLFSQTIKKSPGEMGTSKNSPLDIFTDDPVSDLFSDPFAKAVKTTKGTKKNLFNNMESDDDGADDLFGSVSSKISKSEYSDIDTNEISQASGNSPKRNDAFDDDDDEDLFFDASEKPSSDTGKDDQTTSASSKVTKAKLEDIFGDQSGGEDDIFSIKKPISKGTSANLFFSKDDKDDNTDIFAKKQPSTSEKPETVGHRGSIKKTVTRDLRKTVDDPLSMLNDE